MNPLLDVSFLLTDPDFASSFDVIRRTETIGTTGRSTLATQKFPCVVGVVTIDNDNDLNRGAAFQTQARGISVITQFALQGEVTGRQPDIIYWMGSYYIVTQVLPYGHFGGGFYETLCSSTNYTDPDFASELDQ